MTVTKPSKDILSIAKANLLILDDFGLSPLKARGRNDIMEIIEDRSENGATITTSQLPVDKWYDYIGEPTLADAILDRLIHRAHRIELRGESLREQKRLSASSAKEVSNDA